MCVCVCNPIWAAYEWMQCLIEREQPLYLTEQWVECTLVSHSPCQAVAILNHPHYYILCSLSLIPLVITKLGLFTLESLESELKVDCRLTLSPVVNHFSLVRLLVSIIDTFSSLAPLSPSHLTLIVLSLLHANSVDCEMTWLSIPVSTRFDIQYFRVLLFP